MTQTSVLIIEDDIKLARFLELELKHEGYLVHQAHDGRKGLEHAAKEEVDLVILDVMLPSLNGMEVLRRLRMSSEVPVIMLTAKDDVTDKVMGLNIGADDYLSKPFSIEELFARIRTVLKRTKEPTPKTNQITLGKLQVNLDKHAVTYGTETIDLSKREYDLLVCLLENKDLVLTREQFLDKVWGFDYYGDTNVVDVYIRYLRSKIDEPFKTKLIHSVRGVGYIIKGE